MRGLFVGQRPPHECADAGFNSYTDKQVYNQGAGKLTFQLLPASISSILRIDLSNICIQRGKRRDRNWQHSSRSHMVDPLYLQIYLSTLLQSIRIFMHIA